MNKVYITGDKHGSLRPFFGLAEKQLADSTDIMIITGDAGYVMDDDYMLKIGTLEQLFPGTICFIDGNHENHRLLNSLPVSEWQGGRVHRIGERVIHLMRGELYTIGGENYFTFGGARTVSRFVEGVEGIDWGLGEEPTEEELAEGRDRFCKYLDRIDYVITHEAPMFARHHIDRIKRVDDDYTLPGILDEWYDLISGSSRLKKWYFGHMHTDKSVTPILRGIFNNIVEAGSEERLCWA